MKNYLINSIVNYINNRQKCSNEELQIIRYGIGNLYLQITKMIIITLLALFLRIIVPFTIFLLTFNFIRNVAFGMHSKKSWQCWISSILIFIIVPLIMNHVVIPIYIKQILSIICILIIYKYSPADTKKRPIISSKRRLIYKYLSVIISIIYSFVSIYIPNQLISNCLLASLILQSIIISPITYEIFGLSYNNYKEYGREANNVC